MFIFSNKKGRFGNNIYQLINILYEALIYGQQININQLENLQCILNITDLQKNFNLQFKSNNKNISHHFFPKDLHLSEKRKINLEKYFEISKKYIQPYLLNTEKVSDKICCIHIRSGDLFYNDHTGYVQPPLAYYKKIINEFNNKYDIFYLITEPDMKNPCIQKLKEYSNKIKIISDTIQNDYKLLLSCHSIVLSRSSFSDTSVFLNKNLKNIYFWNHCHCLSDTSVIPKNINVYSLITKVQYI